MKKIKKNKSMFDELMNAMDMVGFLDEVQLQETFSLFFIRYVVISHDPMIIIFFWIKKTCRLIFDYFLSPFLIVGIIKFYYFSQMNKPEGDVWEKRVGQIKCVRSLCKIGV